MSQSSYCPLVWMFHSRQLNNRINHLHEMALRVVYQDSTSSFEELLSLDGSFTIHHRNVQTVAIEMYKSFYNISPQIMDFVFPMNEANTFLRSNGFVTRHAKTVSHGTHTLAHLGPRIWSLVPKDFKFYSLSIFKSNINVSNTLDIIMRILHCSPMYII